MVFQPPTETNPPFSSPPSWPFPTSSERWEADYRLRLLEAAIHYIWGTGTGPPGGPGTTYVIVQSTPPPVATAAPFPPEGLLWLDTSTNPTNIPTGGAGGDLGGTYPNPTVDGLQGNAVSATAPTTGQYLQWNGTAWTPVTGTAAPSGPAGGDLGGTYPNPSVARLQGFPVSSTAPTTGQVHQWNGTNWTPVTISTTPTGAAGGDLTGTYPNPGVGKVNGIAVSGTPAAGNVLIASSPTAAAWGPPAFWPNPNAIFLHPLGSGADDTPQIISAINSAYSTGVSNGTNYGEIWLFPGVYQIKGALVQGGSTLGNSQIPLPVVPMSTQQKFTLAIRSFGDGSSLPIWNQNVAQLSGACLYSSGITGTNDPTYDIASVIGGPTPKQGYGTGTGGNLWSNMKILIDGISVVQALNPTLMAFDFRGIAQAHVGKVGAFVNAATATVAATFPANAWAIGMWLPKQANNDEAQIESFACQGYNHGIYIEEHAVITRLCITYCQSGLGMYQNATAHSNWIGYASIEACVNSVSCETGPGTQFPVVIDCLDVEDVSSGPFTAAKHIGDQNNNLIGYIGWFGSGPGMTGGQGNYTGFPRVNQLEAGNIRIINLERNSGSIYTAADGVVGPVSGTLWRNPFWRDCMVYWTGGTVTSIVVGNATISHTLPSNASPFPLASGAYTTMTFTGSPSFTYVLV